MPRDRFYWCVEYYPLWNGRRVRKVLGWAGLLQRSGGMFRSGGFCGTVLYQAVAGDTECLGLRVLEVAWAGSMHRRLCFGWTVFLCHGVKAFHLSFCRHTRCLSLRAFARIRDYGLSRCIQIQPWYSAMVLEANWRIGPERIYLWDPGNCLWQWTRQFGRPLHCKGTARHSRWPRSIEIRQRLRFRDSPIVRVLGRYNRMRSGRRPRGGAAQVWTCTPWVRIGDAKQSATNVIRAVVRVREQRPP